MTQEYADNVIDWSYTTAEIPAGGLRIQRKVEPERYRMIADALNVLAVERLEADYSIDPLPGGRYRLKGEIRARVVQACIVTLDPVPADIVDRLDVEFRPPAALPTGPESEVEQSILDAEEFEPIVDHRLDVGRIVLETLAAALPPYPRAKDAALDVNEAGPTDGKSTSPFAALADWKPKSG